jgi:hypothetical protein
MTQTLYAPMNKKIKIKIRYMSLRRMYLVQNNQDILAIIVKTIMKYLTWAIYEIKRFM